MTASPGWPLETSRRSLLDAIGAATDLTLVRRWDSLDDELAAAGIRELLDHRPLREIDIATLAFTRGDTALIAGGGFSRPDHGLMTRALAIAELRYERVIVLPGSFDPAEDVVRAALARTKAVVFTCDPASLSRIETLCDARLAHSCSLYLDFPDRRDAGAGVLNAFRSDPMSERQRRPPDNDDISLTKRDLAGWLDAIAAHEVVRTDRGQVMIAAALIGKQVEFAPSPYEELDSLAAFSLSGRSVRRTVEKASAPVTPSMAPKPRAARRSAARVTAIVVSRDRPVLATRALDSLASSTVSLRTFVLDNNSAPEAAQELATACADRPDVELRRSERNLGCGGGRRLAVTHAQTEFVLFLDDDAQLQPGALELLLTELDHNPEAGAVTATVISRSGTIMHSGGALKLTDEFATFGLTCMGQPLKGSQLPASGPTGWVPGTAALIRRALLERFPLEDEMAYFEDNEWCYRVELAHPGSFRRSREALVVHDHVPKRVLERSLPGRASAVEWLAAHALFYGRHGLLLDMILFNLVPELRTSSGKRDLAGARLLMTLVAERGTDWLLMEWINGELEGFLTANRLL